MTGWQHVWECPECGSQIALGETGAAPVEITSPPSCHMGHATREMEQKMSPASRVQPRAVPRDGKLHMIELEDDRR
jgi:hypothetical protein